MALRRPHPQSNEPTRPRRTGSERVTFVRATPGGAARAAGAASVAVERPAESAGARGLSTWQRVLEVSLAACLALSATFAIHGYRLALGPDVFSDEGLYMVVGRSLASGAGLVADRGTFFWHPPLYMLIEALYLRARGLVQADPLQAIYALRWLNVFFSSVTAGVLLVLGYRLHRSLRVGGLMAALFALDPFVQRINRRNMLETLAMLLTLVAITVYFTHRPRPNFWQQLGAGVAFGLAMLTKEIMAVELAALVAYALWARRSQLGDALRVAGVACAIYLVYPAWAFAIGEGERFLLFKTFGVNRLLHALGGLAIPMEAEMRMPAGGSPPFLENVVISLGQYFSTYVLLGVGALATLVLLLRYRRFQGARYAATWACASYGLAAVSVVARVGDQFFYYVLVPALAVTGYALTLLLSTTADPLAATAHDDAVADPRIVPLRRPADARDPAGAPRVVRGLHPAWMTVVLPLAALLVVYDVAQWVLTYGTGRDDAYGRLYYAVRANVPPGETLVVGTDVANYLFQPDYNVAFLRDQRSVVDTRARFFILSSKERWGHYNAITPQFYDWVMSQSRPLVEIEGRTFWTLGLYQRVPPAT